MSGRFTVETVFAAQDRTGSVFSGIQARTKAMQRALSGPINIADRGMEGIKSIGMAAAAAGAGAVGLGLAFREAITPGADFDAAMSAVGAVSLMTRDQVADLEKEARRLGKTGKFSATEVAGGMELMGKAGFTNTQIIAGIGPVLSAAAAEGMTGLEGLGATTSIVSNVIKGMGLDMSETGRVADVLTLASARTNSSISSLGESMSIVAPTARQLKVPFEDATAAVAMLQDAGLDASTAGTAVSTMLTNLAKPPKAVAAQMRAMGVSFQDAHGDMLPFRDVVDQLAKAGKKAGGNMAQVAFFADLVGLRGQKAALNLKDLTAPMAALNAELRDATGSAEKMAALKMDNFNGDMTKLGNLARDVGIDFFDLVKGPLRDASQAAKGWLGDNQDLIKSDVAGWVKGITDNVGPMRENIEKGVALLDNFKDGITDAFGDSATIKVFGTALSAVFGGNDKNGPRMQAYELGKSIGSAADKFIFFSLAMKTASGAVWAFENATTLAKGGKFIWDLGSGAVTAVKSFRALQQIGPANMIAMSNALNGLGTGFGGVAEGAGKVVGLRGSVNAVFDGWAAKAGLAAVAAAAVYAAYDQFKSFENENGGWEGTKAFFGMSDLTNNWGAAGVNDVQNDQARTEAGNRRRGEVSFSETTQGAPLAAAYDRLGSAYGPLAPSALGAPGGVAAAFGLPAPASTMPQVVSTCDQQSNEQAKTNEQLRQTMQDLPNQIAAALKGTVRIQLPPGAKGDVSGGPGVEVSQSGSF